MVSTKRDLRRENPLAQEMRAEENEWIAGSRDVMRRLSLRMRWPKLHPRRQLQVVGDEPKRRLGRVIASNLQLREC